MTRTAQPSEQTQKLWNALGALIGDPDFEEVILFLKANALWGRRAFDAAGFDPYKAATIEGRQTLVDILEIEIREATKWTKTPRRRTPTRRTPQQPRSRKARSTAT